MSSLQKRTGQVSFLRIAQIAKQEGRLGEMLRAARRELETYRSTVERWEALGEEVEAEKARRELRRAEEKLRILQQVRDG